MVITVYDMYQNKKRNKMKKALFILLAAAMTATAGAQNVSEELKADVRRSASNHLAYPGPTAALTPAPQGKRPFYISHYGRHGSRFLINGKEYDEPADVLSRADSLGKLTDMGRSALRRIRDMRREANMRLGELTPLGAEQHRQIARRMYERFPDVFDGETCIDAKSTVVIRCILSMTNELTELKAINPQLRITHDASEHDMWYMNFDDRDLVGKRWQQATRDALEAYDRKHVDCGPLMRRLFNDTAYVSRNVDARRLNSALFKLASTVQNCESRDSISLYDLFTPEEIYRNWSRENVRWYLSYGACPLNGAMQPFTQRNLLRRIIDEADSCIALPHPGATLRFGHETMVLPLTCLLGLNGYDMQVDDMEQLEQQGWVNYRIFPMGANIQFVFYRSSPDDEDVLVKVLLNENEATLPVKTDMAPYYHWQDVRRYYLGKLASYH